MICIDTKGDDMIIYNTIRVVIVEIQTFTIFTFFNYDHLKGKYNRGMLPFVSLTHT